MCGLAGYLDLREEFRIQESVLRSMTDILIHRGPDSSGYFIEGNAGLGFRRLSIIDLQTGDQPLANEDGSLVLTCNGEIYNYPELKKGLLERGHKFRSRTDVEVLLHLYEEEGPAFVNQLNGQFALVIYDRVKKTLFLARDQFGICPLYYAVVDGMFIYASEIKAVLQHPLVPREVDLTGLDQVLSLPGPISPRTLFRHVRSLPAGHNLSVSNGEMKLTEYWDLDYPRANAISDDRTEKYYAEALAELFEQSVRYRLQADVPVGFFLSGGLDSSLIAAMIRRVSPEIQRHSFSVTFSDPTMCEARYQRLMSQSVDSVHHEIPFGDCDIASRLAKVVYHAECPLKETYNTASLALSQATRESGVTVVLNGEGSDELFAGYVGYRFDKVPKKQNRGYDIAAATGDEIRAKLWGDESLRYEKDEYAFRETKLALYSEELSECLDDFDCSNFPLINKDKIQGRHPVHKRSYLDFKLRLAGHLIADHGDKMAMANSIEARYPFLDMAFIDLCRKISPDLKLNGFQEKFILKKVAQQLLPHEIVNREKFAFVAPGSPFLIRQQLDWVEDMLSYDRIKKQGYFNPDTVQFLKAKYSKDDFRLNHALEDDLLIVVLTFGLLQESFRLPSLN